MKRIILCADDYGQTPSISQAIIELIKQQSLSATTCLVTSSYWPSHAKWLMEYKNQVDIGLHLNLTEGAQYTPLEKLLTKAHTGKIDKKFVYDEFNKQIDLFAKNFGSMPDFVDGHQHIHQFPMIRDVFFKVYEERLKSNYCYVRSIYSPRDLLKFYEANYVKKCLLQFTGALSSKRLLLKYNIPHNFSFSGVYAFDDIDYGAIFEYFLKNIADGGLIMCHPGLSDTDKTDTINKARYKEYEFFKSEKFKKLLSNKEIKLSRFYDCSNIYAQLKANK